MRILPKPSFTVPPNRGGENARKLAGKLDFLAGRKTNQSKETPLEKSSPDTEPHIRDIEELTRTDLRKKYPGEYTSWRNMKQRGNYTPQFECFQDFLRHMGPRRSPEFTLDRIDNTNPLYGPNLCRWADKREQANNRSTSVTLTYNGKKYAQWRGQRHPRTQWARMTGQKPDTLRKRMENGWTSDEAIEGERAPSADHFEWPFKDVQLQWRWEQRFRAAKGAGYDDRFLFLRDSLQGLVQRCRADIERIKFEIERQNYLGGSAADTEEDVFYDEGDLVTLKERLEKLETNLDNVEKRYSVRDQEKAKDRRTKLIEKLRALPRVGNPGPDKKREKIPSRTQECAEDYEDEDLDDDQDSEGADDEQ